MFDHRNHGLSATDGARTGLAERFTLDVKTAVRFAKQTVGGRGVTVLWGFSFSCFPSLFLLRDENSGVDGLLCDSGPAASLRPLFYGFFATGVVPIPYGLRSGRARTAMVERAIVRGTAMLDAQWPPPATMGTLDSTPILLIAGTEDSIVPVEEMRAIGDLYPHAEVVELPGEHLAAIKQNSAAYRREVELFVDRIRRTRAQAMKVS
jgi:pimeloyl-ACP methyl ester carboxylesterase